MYRITKYGGGGVAGTWYSRVYATYEEALARLETLRRADPDAEYQIDEVRGG